MLTNFMTAFYLKIKIKTKFNFDFVLFQVERTVYITVNLEMNFKNEKIIIPKKRIS